LRAKLYQTGRVRGRRGVESKKWTGCQKNYPGGLLLALPWKSKVKDDWRTRAGRRREKGAASLASEDKQFYPERDILTRWIMEILTHLDDYNKNLKCVVQYLLTPVKQS